MSPKNNVNFFIDKLEYTPEGALFNPWYEHDEKNDINGESPLIRRKQLEAYLHDRMDSARYVCIGEALGYQGGHFTGIAMTSERILLGHHQSKHGISPDMVFTSRSPQRSSDPAVKTKGFTEPTATIMWKALLQLQINPYNVVLWNALPWHPYDPDYSRLSNRTPTREEFDEGLSLLEHFIELFENTKLIAVGRKAENCLEKLSQSFETVRHPAHGGAPKFKRQMTAITEAS